MSSIKLASALECTGCGACESACTCSALSMKSDHEGFLRPVIDEDTCVECHACEKACPALNLPTTNALTEPDIYALWADEETRKSASSGGVFPVLAREILSRGGYVCGVVWDDNFRAAKHVVSNDEETVRKMSSSKYVQSDMKRTMEEVYGLLRQGKTVLFSGSPCQVAGLKKFIGSKRHTGMLYTMDFFCHGAPSPAVYEKYISELVEEHGEGGRLVRYDFRDKSEFGWGTACNAYFDNDVEYHESGASDPYLRLFGPIAIMRPSCSVCKYAYIPRQADISVGDFWGCENYKRELNDGKGTSFALVNSENGRELFAAVKDKFPMLEENVPLDAILPINPTPNGPFTPHPSRGHVFASLKYLPLDKLCEHALSKKYDVAVDTLWYGKDYGSILSGYAMYDMIGKLGYDPILTNRPSELWSEEFDDENSVAHRFIGPRCNIAPRYRKPWEERLLNDIADTFVTGPDVMWHYGVCGRGVNTRFMLDNIAPDKKRVGYAVEYDGKFGGAPAEYVNRAETYVNAYDRISTSVGSETIMYATGECSSEGISGMLDPVLAMEWEDIRSIIDNTPEKKSIEKLVREQGAYTFGYFTAPGPRKMAALREGGNLSGLPAMMPALNRDIEAYDNVSDIHVLADNSMESWLSAIACAHMVVTDNLYCAYVAAICGVPFAFGVFPEERDDWKGGEELRRLGLGEYVCSLDEMSDKVKDIAENWDGWTGAAFSKFLEKRAVAREHACEWLGAALKNNAMSAMEKHTAAKMRMLFDTQTDILRKISDGEERTIIEPQAPEENVPQDSKFKRGARYLRKNGVAATCKKIIG